MVDVVADRLQQVGLAESRRSVDEQRVVRPSRDLGDAQRRSEGELVGGSLHERLEHVSGIEPRREQAEVWRHERCLLIGEREVRLAAELRRPGLRGVDERLEIELRMLAEWVPDLDLEAALRRAELVEGSRHEGQISSEDLVAHDGAGDADPQHAAVAVERDDVLERGEPHGFVELGSQQLGNGGPQLGFVAQPCTSTRPAASSTSLSTQCGKPWDGDRASDTNSIATTRKPNLGPVVRVGRMALAWPVDAFVLRARRLLSDARAASPCRGGSCEEDVPAEHPAPGPQAWFPRQDAHPGGSRHLESTSRQGSRPSLGLIWRLRGHRSFEQLVRTGSRVRTSTLWCTYILDPSTTPPRVAFSIGRAVGPAVVRNRIRRRLRTILRTGVTLPPGRFLIGVSPAIRERTFDALVRELRELSERVAMPPAPSATPRAPRRPR